MVCQAVLGRWGVWAVPHYQILSVMKTHPLICFSLRVMNAEGLGSWACRVAPLYTSLHLLLCFPFLFSLLKLQTRTSFPNGLERTWLLGCVLPGGWFGAKLLCAGLVLKDSVPQGAFPFLSIGSGPAVLCKTQHFLGSKL